MTDIMSRSYDVEVVLVVYRSRSHVEELLATWPQTLPVAVVDNSGNIDGVREVAQSRPNTRYLDGGGVGFGRAANLGAFTSHAEFVVFVNPDSRPVIEHLLALVDGLKDDRKALSHAATMQRADGQTEMGVGGWEPTVRRTVAYALALHTLAPRAGVFARPPEGQRWDVEWTTGACMAVDLARFRAVGGFDEMFYVYAEDMALGRRARRAGLRQVLRADVRVPHGAGNSGAPSKEMLRLRGASFANYMLSYHPPARAHAVIGAMGAGFLARGVVAARGDRTRLAPYVAFALGLATRRAYVGGVEVAEARYQEVSEPLQPRRGLVGWASRRRSV